MVLVDTSVWIDHFRTGVRALVGLLNHNRVLMHPFILGEIACGNLRDRRQTLQLLSSLPGAAKASDDEVLTFIESRDLMGKGIGLIDAHLLAAVALTGDATIWTSDRRLQREAERLELFYRSDE